MSPGSGSDRLLVFVASNEQQAATTPSLTVSPTGGQPLTHVVSDEELYNFITSRIEIWVLDEAGIAAAAGTTLSPTWTSAPDVALYSPCHLRKRGPNDALRCHHNRHCARRCSQSGANERGRDKQRRHSHRSGHRPAKPAPIPPQNGFTLGLTQDTTVGGTSAHGTAYKPATGSERNGIDALQSCCSTVDQPPGRSGHGPEQRTLRRRTVSPPVRRSAIGRIRRSARRSMGTK